MKTTIKKSTTKRKRRSSVRRKRTAKKSSPRIVFKNARGAEWFNGTSCLGDTFATELAIYTEDIVNKSVKGKWGRWIVDSIGVDSDSWSFYNSHWSKSDANRLRYILRRIDTYMSPDSENGVYELLHWLGVSGPVWKCKLTHILEYLALHYDKDSYLRNYMLTYGYLGMSKEDAENRFYSYHETASSRRTHILPEPK